MDMEMRMRMPFPPPGGVMDIDMAMITENDQDTTGTEVQLDWIPFENHYLITGFDYSGDDLDADFRKETVTTITPPGSPSTTTDKFNYKAKMDTYAFYIQDEWIFLEDFTLTAGFRETWIESELSDTDNPDINKEKTTDSHPVFSADLVWTGIENLALRGLFAQGYKFPNLQQLYIGTVHGGRLPTLPNPDLDPETSNNYEVGARYENDTFYFDVGAFMSRSKDYITTEEVLSGTARQYRNVNEAKTHGVELSAGYTIKQLYLTPYLTGAWLKRKFESDGLSTWDTGYPDFTGRFGVRFERDFWKPDFTLFADLYGRAASEASEEFSDGTEEKYGSWETANFTIGTYFGKERQYRFDVNLNNIFDRKYKIAHGNLTEPGFHAVAKATITF
jgi:Outer membrane receptor proteins, mostly Fe transport